MRFALAALFLVAVVSALPVDNPDKYMYNPGMLGGDIAGGYKIQYGPDGRTSIIPDSNWYDFWPGGIIYYELHSSIESDRAAIMEAMNEYHINTCIRFVERNGDSSIKNYVLIRGDQSGCWSYMGRYVGGYQELSLQKNGCVYKGTIMHELMHAAGFWHEHQRYDRDDYVDIIWGNIISGYESNFDKAELNVDAINQGGVSYDFDSVMHYELTAFTSNGARTIEPKDPSQDPGFVWAQNYFSQGDIKQLNAAYNCGKQ